MDNSRKFPQTAYGQRQQKMAQTEDESQVLHGALGAIGWPATIAALMDGDLLAAGVFGLPAIGGPLMAADDARQAQDHRLKGRAVEDLIMRSRRQAHPNALVDATQRLSQEEPTNHLMYPYPGYGGR